MKQGFSATVVFMSMLFAAAATYIIVSAQYSYLREDDMLKYYTAKSYIENEFVGEYEKKELSDGAINGMVDALGDRWSHYLTSEQYGAYQETLNNAYVGIGVTVEYGEEHGGFLITKVTEGAPAQEAGIDENDVITHVGGVSVTELGSAEAKARIKGEEGTVVLLTVKKTGGETAEVTVVRAAVAAVVVTHRMLEGEIGYIAIDNFDSGVAEAFHDAMLELSGQGAKGFIFDVRFNPGGMLTQLLSMLDLLLPEGTIFISRDREGNDTLSDSDEACIEAPMAVLVNADSYSAAEFFAAALQEYGWAHIVGENTTGKGYSQSTLVLEDGSALVISTNEYFTPGGVSLANVGIQVDHAAALTDEERALLYYDRLPETDDKQLQAAVALLGREIDNLGA